MEPIEKAKDNSPVIAQAITIVSSVPTILQLIVLAILRTVFSDFACEVDCFVFELMTESKNILFFFIYPIGLVGNANLT